MPVGCTGHDFFMCIYTTDPFKLTVEPGEKYMLRLINATLNDELFFCIANHTLIVIDVDVLYVKPFTVDTLVIASGQTSNVSSPPSRCTLARGTTWRHGGTPHTGHV